MGNLQKLCGPLTKDEERFLAKCLTIPPEARPYVVATMGIMLKQSFEIDRLKDEIKKLKQHKLSKDK